MYREERNIHFYMQYTCALSISLRVVEIVNQKKQDSYYFLFCIFGKDYESFFYCYGSRG
jgi:hypothetical protein